MSVPSLRQCLFGAFGLVVAAGAAGCSCAGQTGQPRPGKPRAARAHGGATADDQFAMFQEQDLVDRVDRLELQVENGFSSLHSELSGLRAAQTAAPALVNASYQPPVVPQPQPPAVEYPSYGGEMGWDIQPQGPIVGPAPAASLSANRRNLEKRHLRVDVSVRELQRALADAGANPGKVDGVLGKNTIEAIRRFQRDNNLKVDGIVGPNTWDRLRLYTTPAGGASRGGYK